MGFVALGNATETLNAVALDSSCSVPLDLQAFRISSAVIKSIFECMGGGGMQVYRSAVVVEDTIYPVAYGLFFGFTLLSLTSFCIPSRKWLVTIISVLPLLAMCSDFLENHFIVKAIDGYPALPASVVNSLWFFNSMKWGVSIPMLLAVLLFSVFSLVKVIRKM